MTLIAYLFASGDAYFVGLAVVAGVALLSALVRWRLAKRIFRLGAVFGVAVTALSATPLPIWAYPLWCAIVVAWLLRERVAGAEASAGVLRGMVFASCVALAVWEAPHLLPEKIPCGGTNRLYIMGDSMAFGPGGGSWPRLLQDLTRLNVSDLTEGGQPLARTRRRTAFAKESPSVVILSLGGRDMADKLDVDEFEAFMRQVIVGVKRKTRSVAMLELPLRPFQNQYGAVQRELSAKHGVILVPKRILARLLCKSDQPLGQWQLLPEQHEELARILADLLDGDRLTGSL